MTEEQKILAFEERALELTVEHAPKHEYTDPDSGLPCFSALGFARDLLKAIPVDPEPGTTEYGSWINTARRKTDILIAFHRDPFKYLCAFEQELRKLAGEKQ